jgi:organic anion transporter 3A
VGGVDDLNASSGSGVTKVPVATAGPCYTPCEMIFPFIVLLFFMTLLVAITQMPVLMVVLRSVAEEEKAFALGIQFVIFRLFGYIPSPIVFGNVIDSTCLVWKQTCEGSQGGRCLMYDIELFRYKYVGICAGIKTLSFFIFLFDWWLIRQKQLKEKEEGGLTMGEVVNSMVSIDKLFEAEGSAMGSQVAIDKQMESEEGRVMVAGDVVLGGGSSAESTPTHSNLTPSRQPMIPDSKQK